jgi:hypothetical protein
MSPADFADLRRQQKVFAGLAAFRLSNSNLTGGGEPERVRNSEVTAEFFRLLGFEATLGRAFLPEEERASWNTRRKSSGQRLFPAPRRQIMQRAVMKTRTMVS